jgi:LPS-assembly protein
MQYTQYVLTHQETPYTADVSRALPILSIDGGMTFERDVNLFGKNLSHTIEPRLFYLYIPKKDQSNIPIFDSSLYDFWYSNLFRENRFSGTDRVQDANQITTALTSRLLDAKTGKERLRFDIGEIFYFRNRDVTIPLPYFDPIKNQLSLRESPIETDAYSNLISELSGSLTDHISVETGVQWNPTSHDVERGKAILHFHGAPDELFNIGYLYRKNPLIPDRSNDIIQTDMSFRWPIYDNWYAVGRWQYSLLYNTTQESFVGLEKENCCWRFRIIGRQYINAISNGALYINPQAIAEGTSQTGIFFQVEFKGLTGIGEKLDDFFAKSIYGYRKPDS